MGDTFFTPSPHSTQAPTMTSLAAFPALTLRVAALAACALLLQACGGGGGSGDAGTPVASPSTVTGVAFDRLSYGRLSTFTVTGTNLATAVSFSASGCDGLAMLAGGTVTQQKFTCTPNKTLSVGVGASVSGSAIYAGTPVAVPKPQVTLITSLGSVVVELEPAAAPLTVDNYLAYVNANFYNGTIFHRVESDFVVQGGGFTGVVGSTFTPQLGARPAIALETNKGLSNLRGTIAMARSGLPDTATSEFFFNTVNNTFLDYASAASPGYAVFGHIFSGQAVVDAMNAVPTYLVGGFHVPVTNITLTSATQTL